jgi:hypothetical protein
MLFLVVLLVALVLVGIYAAPPPPAVTFCEMPSVSG